GCTATNTITINVSPVVTVANAGPDQSRCFGDTVILAANSPASGTGSWSVTFGPFGSQAQFSDVTSPTSTFIAPSTGSYVLRWTISNGVCTSSSDNVVINSTAVPVITLLS